MTKPDLTGVSPEVVAYIDALFDELFRIKTDNRILLYEAINNKLEDLADEINATRIRFSDKDDKAFDRLMKAMVESKLVAENLKWLRNELGIADKKEVTKEAFNPIENRAKKFRTNNVEGAE